MFPKTQTIISENLFKSVFPIFRLNRMFCLLPLRWEKMNTNYVITRSTAYSIYSLVMISLMEIGCIYGRSQLFTFETYQKRLANTTTACIIYTDLFINLFVSLTNVTLTCFRVNKYIELIENLKNADYYLRRNYVKNCSFLTKIFLTYLIFLIGYFHMIQWWKILGHEHNFILILFYSFPFYFCSYIYAIIDLLYFQTVNFIRIRLASLNNHLSELFHSNDQFTRFRTTDGILHIVTQQHGGKSAKIFKQVQNLIKAYRMLVQATRAVNEGFGLAILISMFGCFIHVIVVFHNIYSILTALKEVDFMVIASQVAWLLLHLFRLFLIIQPCHGCLSEVEDALFWICKLLENERDEGVEKKLNFFILFISRCKVEFNACGFTKIHRGILVMMVGSVTTYLAIVFQFN